MADTNISPTTLWKLGWRWFDTTNRDWEDTIFDMWADILLFSFLPNGLASGPVVIDDYDRRVYQTIEEAFDKEGCPFTAEELTDGDDCNAWLKEAKEDTVRDIENEFFCELPPEWDIWDIDEKEIYCKETYFSYYEAFIEENVDQVFSFDGGTDSTDKVRRLFEKSHWRIIND